MESKAIEFFDKLKSWNKPDLWKYCLVLVERTQDIETIVNDKNADKKRRAKAAVILTNLVVRYENVLYRFNNFEVKTHPEFKEEKILKEQIHQEEQNYINLKREEREKCKQLPKEKSLIKSFLKIFSTKQKKKK